MKVAVLLTTRCREDMTAETLRTFAEHHKLSRFLLLHGDDASPTRENKRLAAQYGFETVYDPERQLGHMASFRALMHVAMSERSEWVLNLENDWQWVRPTPSWAHEAMEGGDWPDVDCIRLYGAAKARSGPRAPTGANLMGADRPIAWRACWDGVEYAPECHFAGPPSYIRTDVLWPWVRELPTFKEVGKVLHMPTLRPVENCVWHLGDTVEKSTPGFMQ